MTPEKVLDYSVKFGVVPFMFYMIVITRNDLDEMKRDLNDCYEDRIEELKPRSVKGYKDEPLRLVAVLPNKCKSIKECLS